MKKLICHSTSMLCSPSDKTATNPEETPSLNALNALIFSNHPASSVANNPHTNSQKNQMIAKMKYNNLQYPRECFPTQNNAQSSVNPTEEEFNVDQP